MMKCSVLKPPCSVHPPPPPPPCPPPPPKPFPWIFVWSFAVFVGTVGLLYKWFLYRERKNKSGEFKPIWRPRRKTRKPHYPEDLPQCVQYLIIGTGAAGWAGYQAIMEHDKKAKVLFVTNEDILPYIRPPMSKTMFWNAEPPEIHTLHYVDEGKLSSMFTADCKHYVDAETFNHKRTGPAVTVAYGWCVQYIDADDQVAWVKAKCGNRPIYYERLLFAPGSRPKHLRVFRTASKPVREKICHLRTIRDLEIAYRKVKEAKHVTVVGDGVLGSELAWHLGRMGKELAKQHHKQEGKPPAIAHVIKNKGILAGILPEYLGEWAVEKIKCEGVNVISNAQVYDGYETPDGRLELTLSNGASVVTDYVFVAVGAEPREELAKDSFLELDRVNGGYLVNTEMKARTHTYVAGDAASVYIPWKDTRMRMEHYDNAEEQGYIAGMNMTGYQEPYNAEPHYWFKLGEEIQMEVVGEVGACMPTVGLFKPCTAEEMKETKKDDKSQTGDGDKPCYKKTAEYKHRYKRGILFYLRDNYIVGLLFWNMPAVPDRKGVATEILRARPTVEDLSLVADLLGFPDAKCAGDILGEEVVEEPVCFKNLRIQ